MNLALIELDGKLTKYRLSARIRPREILALNTQVHDAVDVDTPARFVKDVSDIVTECMERPRNIGGRLVSFPVELKTGTHWDEV